MDIKIKSLLLIFTLYGYSHSTPVFAAVDEDDNDIEVIEVELKSKHRPKANQPEAEEETTQTQEVEEKPKIENMQFSDLGKLAPFKEVSVIQKRYMPKTTRFQIYGGPTLVTNDPFFITAGLQVKTAFYFSETIGVELNYFALGSTEKQTTQELRSIQGVKTEGLVFPNVVTAADVTYVPMYGKFTWFNKKIIPFDHYFSLGYGLSQVNTGSGVGTLHLATGQIFSISKSYAVRWDFSWNAYSTTGIDGQVSQFNNLFISVGMSIFFPEADYR